MSVTATPPVNPERRLHFESPGAEDVSISASRPPAMMHLPSDSKSGEVESFWLDLIMKVVRAVREVWQRITAKVQGKPYVPPLVQAKEMTTQERIDALHRTKQIPDTIFSDLEHLKSQEIKNWLVKTVCEKYTQFFSLISREEFLQQPFLLLLHILKPIPQKGVFEGMAIAVRNGIWREKTIRPTAEFCRDFLHELAAEAQIENQQLHAALFEIFRVQQNYDQEEFRKLFREDQNFYEAFEDCIRLCGLDGFGQRVFGENPFCALLYLDAENATKYIKQDPHQEVGLSPIKNPNPGFSFSASSSSPEARTISS